MALRCNHYKSVVTVEKDKTVITAYFCEGDITTEKVFDILVGKLVDVTRYRASKIIKKVKYTVLSKQTEKETDIYLNDKLKIEVPTKTPIDEQDNTKIAMEI